jgi:hypothetical protein
VAHTERSDKCPKEEVAHIELKDKCAEQEDKCPESQDKSNRLRYEYSEILHDENDIAFTGYVAILTDTK